MATHFQIHIEAPSTLAVTSVSIGLIVTELVINALKHAFPAHRHGKITVGYEAHGPRWTLTVADDGIGMPSGVHAAKPGLGTGIVQALVGQLRAEISIADAAPGTAVSISHVPGLQLVKSIGGETQPGATREGTAY